MILGFVLMYFIESLILVGISLLMALRSASSKHFSHAHPTDIYQANCHWQQANLYCSRLLFVAGAANVLTALLFTPMLLIPGAGTNTYLSLCGCMMLGSLLWAGTSSFRYLQKR